MDKCSLCELGNVAKRTCQMGVGTKKARIMMIVDCPTVKDNEAGKVFSGKSVENMRKAMEKRGINLDEVYYTYAVKCSVPDDKEPSNAHLKACIDTLMAEIEVINPDIIVPMGNISMRAVMGKTGITKHRGKAFEIDGRIILPTYNPVASLRKPAYKDWLLKDLDTLADIYKNGMSQSTTTVYKVLDNYVDILSEIDKLEIECLKKNPDTEWLSFDLETTGKNPFLPTSKIVCISLSNKETTGITIPLYHRESPLWGDEIGVVVKRLRKLLENPNIPKCAHNGKFDIKWLEVFIDILVKNFSFDTMLAHYLAVSEELGTQGLKGLAWEYTDMGGYDNALDEYKSTLPEDMRNNYDNIPWSILSVYASADVDCCLRLLHLFKPMIDANPKWVTMMNDIMMPASYALKDVEVSGMFINKELCVKYDEEYTKEISRIQDRLESYPEIIELEREKLALYAKRQALMASVPAKNRTPEEKSFIAKSKKYENYKFNWASVQQLQELLFDRLKLVTTVKTDTGAFSTGEDSLIEMESQHELPKLMMEFRKVSTANNMFIQKVPKMTDVNDIIHPSYNPAGTVTGRLSSEDPNSQQFPRKSEDPTSFQYHHEVKTMFKSRFGKDGCILQWDYSQLELRVAGMISGDKNLLKIYLSGQDLHKATASLVWGVPIDEVLKDMRTNAKAVNFGIIYGKSGITFAKDLYSDLPWEKAKKAGNKLVDDYLKAFPELAKWIDDAKASAYELGYSETMFGRRRRLPDLRSKDNYIRSEAERMSINAPIQGTGSDMTLLAIVLIQDWINKTKKKSKTMCTVHDSIVFDVYLPELPEVFTKVKDIMEHVHVPYFGDVVPIVAEAELGVEYGSIFEVDSHMDINNSKLFEEWVHSEKEKKRKHELDVLRDKKYTDKQIKVYTTLYH